MFSKVSDIFLVVGISIPKDVPLMLLSTKPIFKSKTDFMSNITFFVKV